MIFKERTFRGRPPRDEVIEKTPAASAAADLETQGAEFLASLDALDVTQVSLVAVDESFVLSGFVPTEREAEAVAASLQERFPGVVIENRLKVG